MERVKYIFAKYYSIKLILLLLITTLTSLLFKFYPLSGSVLIALTIYVFIDSLKNKYFKKKKLITKCFIYFFIIIFTIDGILLLGGNKSTNNIRVLLSIINM